MEKLENKKKETLKIIDRKKYSTLLRRKRLENKLTLEELSTGVCTASYLSRIENNLVDVTDEYYSLLFKKLDVDFLCLKEEKENPIFNKLMRYYLLKDLDGARETIIEATKKGLYSAIEYDLMVLFDSITRELFMEAEKLIKEIDEKINTLQDDEVNFYLFLQVLYLFNTSRYLKCSIMIKKLIDGKLINLNESFCIGDIFLTVLFKTKEVALFLSYYSSFLDISFVSVYQKATAIHKMEYLILTHDPKLNNNMLELDELYKEYQIGTNYLVEFRYNEALDVTNYLGEDNYSIIIGLIYGMVKHNGIMVGKLRKKALSKFYGSYNLYYKMIIEGLLHLYHESYIDSAKNFSDALNYLVKEVNDIFLIKLTNTLLLTACYKANKCKSYVHMVKDFNSLYSKKL